MGMKKRGQVTVFIIVGLVIAVGVLLVYLFYPGIKSSISGEIIPNDFLRNCVEQDVRDGVTLLAKQGGYANPQGYLYYGGNNVKYLCYNSEYYLPCVVQQPLIVSHFEKELGEITNAKTRGCVNELRAEYESRGYDVSQMPDVKTEVKILPKRINVKVEAPMTVTKDTAQSFKEFDIDFESEMYDLLLIATNIIDFESTYGDSETSLYLKYYPDLEIDKIKLGEGSTFYRVKNSQTGEEFSFASRSGAWPAGYGAFT